MNYRVIQSRHEDIESGHVWIEPKAFASRQVVKLTRQKNRRSVYCEALAIDKNFRWIYRRDTEDSLPKSSSDGVVVISKWYRDILEMPDLTDGFVDQFEISAPGNKVVGWWYAANACLAHPQTVVRVSMKFGIAGTVVGIVGLLPNFESLIWKLISCCVCR